MSGHPERIGVIALPPDLWDDVVMTRHQVLERLARHFAVAWIEPPEHWRDCLVPGGSRFLRRDRWTSPAPGLEVLAPGFAHPRFYRPAWLHRLSLRSRLAAARRRLVALGATRIVLYLWRDEFAEAVDLVRHDSVVYHIDDEYSFSDVEVPNPPREVALMRRADDVIVHSKPLLQKKSGIAANLTLVPNGVDYGRFADARPEPADLAAIPHPRIGYVGVIKKQLDIALLDRLASERPGYSFVLVGPVLQVAGKEQDLDRLARRPNVTLLGSRPAAALGAYLQHMDACLMCYEVNAYTRYIYPLKLHEYLASGRPVVSSRIDSVVEHGDVVRLADGAAEWLEAVDASLRPEANTAEAVARRRARARQFDWSTLVARIAAVIRERLASKTPGGQRRPSARGAA